MRIWFTGEDVARTRLADGPSPLIETVLSSHRPCCPAQGAVVLGPWQRRTSGLRRGLVETLCARPKSFPDFVFRPPHGGPMPEYLDDLAAIPRSTIEASVVELARDGAVTRALGRLAAGDRATMGTLIGELDAYHDAAIAPLWPGLVRRCRADLARRAALVASGGIDGLLANLHPTTSWSYPVLTTPASCADDVELGGAGVLLVPSVFVWPHVLVVYDVPQPMIVYPVADIFGIVDPAAADDEPVAALIGRTRAALLSTVEAVSGTASTTDLARRLGISVALASHHLRVLRDAGLLTTTREGRTTRHALTPLAGQLLVRPLRGSSG